MGLGWKVYFMNEIRKHLMNILYSGHKHKEISEAIVCYECGGKMKSWEAEHNRLRKLYPHEFIRQEPVYQLTTRTQQIAGLLEDRLKNDKKYRKEIENKFRQQKKR